MYIELVQDNVEIIHAIQESDIQEIISHLRKDKRKNPGSCCRQRKSRY